MVPIRALVIALLLGLLASFGPAADTAVKVAKAKPIKWLNNYEGALNLARKEKKTIIVYFSGSDWEPFTQKLEKDVLTTDMFREWAASNVVLLQCDFARDKPSSGNIKSQNDRLKQRFSIVKVPTFILMDSSGLPFARLGFDEAKLRDDEGKGEPRAWIKILEETIKNRPPDEDLVKQKGLAECIAYGKKHFLSSVFLISQGHLEHFNTIKDEMMHNQQFVRFMNHNVAFAEIEWPYDTDTSLPAAQFRQFVADQNISPAPLQVVVYDMQTKKVRAKIHDIDPARAENLVSLVERQLPRLDYNSGWIEDYHMAQAVAQQQKRYIFIAFTDYREFSKKMDDEIFNTDEFKQYARKKLCLLRVNFPAADTQPAQPPALATQNKILAELFAIRGFPSVILLNPLGQRIGDGKYMKGGPEAFLKAISAAVKADEDKRNLLRGIDKD